MGFSEQVGKKIVALLLFAALMLPSAIQFGHILDGHEHVVCAEQTAHIHKSVIKCEINSFHLASFKYDIAKYPDLVLPAIPVKLEVDINPLQFHSFKITNNPLRAPPVFS